MKLIQGVLLIMLAVGLSVAKAEGNKTQCPLLKNKTAWNNPPPEKATYEALAVVDGPKGRETVIQKPANGAH
jgi:hypothetical protein